MEVKLNVDLAVRGDVQGQHQVLDPTWGLVSSQYGGYSRSRRSRSRREHVGES